MISRKASGFVTIFLDLVVLSTAIASSISDASLLIRIVGIVILFLCLSMFEL